MRVFLRRLANALTLGYFFKPPQQQRLVRITRGSDPDSKLARRVKAETPKPLSEPEIRLGAIVANDSSRVELPTPGDSRLGLVVEHDIKSGLHMRPKT